MSGRWGLDLSDGKLAFQDEIQLEFCVKERRYDKVCAEGKDAALRLGIEEILKRKRRRLLESVVSRTGTVCEAMRADGCR